MESARIYQWVMLDPEDNDVSHVHPNISDIVGLKLRGKVFNHPSSKDGAWLVTSQIAWGDQKNRHVICVDNIHYKLGAHAVL
jgi:hypothetical protein